MKEKIKIEDKRKGMGIAGFVLGLLSVILCILNWLSMVFAILGFIFSAIQISRKSNGLAVAGLVLSILGFIFSFIWLLLFVSMLY